jgi:hypothetical protein
MDQGAADSSVVVTKLGTEENMATYLRIKFPEGSRKAEGEGMDMLMWLNSNNRNYDHEIRNKSSKKRGNVMTDRFLEVLKKRSCKQK